MNTERMIYRLILMALWIGVVQYHALAQEEISLKGTWVNAAGTRRADFDRQGVSWVGTLVWGGGDSKVKAGDILFKDLVWDGKQFKGKANTPRGVADCTVSFDGADRIKVTGSKGGMSRTVYWTRVK